MTHTTSGLSESSVERHIPHPGFEITGVPTIENISWPGGNPAGAIELSDTELQAALIAAPICSEYASISTTWCDNPKACP